jgi:uncharacterized protein (DUF58 family)
VGGNSEIRNPKSEILVFVMAFTDAFPGFRLRMTRWGLAYLAACVVLGLAAVNTGNNALMAILGLALGSYVISGLWSRQVLGNIGAQVQLPKEVFAGRTAVVEVELFNSSRFFPAYGLVVRGADGGAVLGEALLAPGAKRSHSVETVFPDRGWHHIGPWRLEVVLPLGFFLKSKTLVFDAPVLVFPRLVSRSSLPVRRGGGRRAPDALESRGREGDVTQLRGFREGDEVRALHWKQTARQQTLVVVERQRAAEKAVYFVVDSRLEAPDDPIQRERFERLVSEAATGVVRRLREGVPVGLVVGEEVFQPVRTSRRAPVLLKPLAEVQPRRATDPAPAIIDSDRKFVFAMSGTTA